MNAKLVQISFHFEFSEEVERILDRNGIRDFLRHPAVEGRDADAKHDGSRVHPGILTVVQAQVSQEGLEPLLADLEAFRAARKAHQHLQALVLPIERRLG